MSSRRTGRDRDAAAPPAPDPALVERLVREAREKLRSASSQRTAEEHHKFFEEAIDCYGVRPPEVHRIGTDLIREVRGGGLALALEVAEPLWLSGNLEEGVLADQQLSAFARHIGGSEFDRFARWVEPLTNWANADSLATHLIARALAGRPSMTGRLLEWTRSPSRWRRRVAATSFVPLVREGRFLTDALTVAEPLMTDQDEMVHQGVGWLLQEASRLQPERVVEFLQPWREKASPALLRIAVEKMSPAQRTAAVGP